jgi:hypothetical protein
VASCSSLVPLAQLPPHPFELGIRVNPMVGLLLSEVTLDREHTDETAMRERDEHGGAGPGAELALVLGIRWVAPLRCVDESAEGGTIQTSMESKQLHREFLTPAEWAQLLLHRCS